MSRRLLTRALAAALAVAAAVAVGRLLLAEPPADGTATSAEATPTALLSARYTTVVDLAGPWQLRVGDDLAWATAPGDTALWQSVPVPGAWEDAGLWGYDGFAWLRRTFTLPAGASGRPLVLRLGRVDDADEVFVNGQRIGGTGAMPPAYATAYYAERAYYLPAGALRPGANTLAVRVYDGELAGGIVTGPVEIAVATADTAPGTPLVADLAGRWRAADGDQAAWREPAFDDAAWVEITVPERWESQGYPDLGGFVWMRRAVTLTAAQAGQPLVFVAGAIDDLDEVFVNGTRIGGTGLPGRTVEGLPVTDSDARQRPRISGDEWTQPRAYAVPPGLLRPGRNVVAVRVYDGLVDGGIVQGPVGLAAPDAARAFVRALGGPTFDGRVLGAL